MSDDAVSISLSDEERLFVDSQMATGKYADDADVLHAGLAALEREWKLLDWPQMIAKADAQFEQGEYRGFNEGDDLAQYIQENADGLRRELANAEYTGESGRQVPDIMNAVKTKLRANGTL